MGAVGTSADNSPAESFNAALKREVLQDENYWPNANTCRRQAFRWLTRYNTIRRHSWCRYQSPGLLRGALTLVLGHAESSICWGSEMIPNYGPQELL